MTKKNRFGISCHRFNVVILIGQKKKKKGTTFVHIFEKSKLSSLQERDIGKNSKELIIATNPKVVSNIAIV